MGFFFEKAKKATKATKRGGGALFQKGGVSAALRQNASALRRLGCKGCPLNDAKVHTPKMGPTLAGCSSVVESRIWSADVRGSSPLTLTKILFIAEAPGKDEDENTGRPLTGPSGKLLRECIPDGEEINCAFDNTVNCRPENNRTPTWVEVQCCHPRRVQAVEKIKPKLIVGLGAVPMHWMLNSTDMAGMRGRIFAVQVGGHSCWYMPAYHPSFILRIAKNKRKPLNSMMGHCFRMDIKRAFDFANRCHLPNVDTEVDLRRNIKCFDGTNGFDELCQLLEQAEQAPEKTVDIETKGLRPYSTGALLLSAAFSFDDTHFSFAVDHPKAGWTEQQLGTLKTKLKDVLKDRTIKIVHNAPFEIEWFIWLLGIDVVDHAVWQCTQMQAHFIDERRGRQQRGTDSDKKASYQKLDFLYKQYFGIAYKSLFKLDKKDMSKGPLAELLIYNVVDTKATQKLFRHQRLILQERGLQDAYLEALPRQPTVAMMQHFGIGVDQVELKKNQTYLAAHIENINIEINKLKAVQKYKQDKGEFNPQSEDHLIEVFRDYLHITDVVIEEENTTKFSTKKSILDGIDHPLAGLVLSLRNKVKLKSTYVDPLEQGVGEWVYPDGKIHCNINTTFAETGRTSSDSPNTQNVPQRNDSWVRAEIVPPKGHLLLAFDYGQLEACTGAMCSRDKVLVKALWEDYDIHMEWAERCAHRYPDAIGGLNNLKDAKLMKRFRSLIKNKLVFPVFFGAQNSSVAGYLKMPQDVIDDLMDEFWKQFSGFRDWQERLMKGYWENGYVEAPTGRRHYYPITRNQAINMPVQNLAADIVCDAMNRLSYHAAVTKQWHLHPILNIHDDLTAIVPDDDKVIEKAVSVIYETMLTPPYSCVNVPLSVKASIGKNWYEMEEIGTFWSHKDLK